MGLGRTSVCGRCGAVYFTFAANGHSCPRKRENRPPCGERLPCRALARSSMTTPSVPPHPVSGPGRHPSEHMTPEQFARWAVTLEHWAALRGLPPDPWPPPRRAGRKVTR